MVMIENYHLRPIALADASELFALTDNNRAYLRQWLPWLDATNSVQDSRAFLQSALENTAKGRERHFFIVANGDIIGTCAVRNLVSDTPDIGYWLAESHRGRGVTVWAVAQLLQWLRTETQAQAVIIRCASGNQASRRVAEKCGFHFQSRQAQAENLYGVWHDVDTYIFSL